jgi:hypothetical protein
MSLAWLSKGLLMEQIRESLVTLRISFFKPSQRTRATAAENGAIRFLDPEHFSSKSIGGRLQLSDSFDVTQTCCSFHQRFIVRQEYAAFTRRSKLAALQAKHRNVAERAARPVPPRGTLRV